MLDRFSATIQLLYAAAGGSVPWSEALVAIEDLTGSTGAVVDLIPKHPGAPPKTISGSFSDENCADYAANYQSICPRIRFAVERGSGGTQVDYMFINEEQMDHDPVYDWYGTHGLRYHIAGTLSASSAYLAAFSLQRTRRQGHAQARDVVLFDLLKPHVERALQLADQLGTLQSFAKFSSAMFEASPNGLFALDENGTILFANSRAECYLKRSEAFVAASGRLTAALASEQVALDLVIREAAATPSHAGRGWTRVSRVNGGPPYAVFVAPLKIDDEELLAQNAKVLVIVHDMGEHHAADAHMLVALYDLTDAEARLASALSAGHSVESAAAQLGVQVTTVRSQIQSVFRKMGVNRQQDLVRLLVSLPGLL